MLSGNRKYTGQTPTGVASTLAAAVFALAVVTQSYAAEETGGLQLPEDLAAKAAQGSAESRGTAPKYTIEERRIGGRLERITIHRDNGIDETYENVEIDSMWQSEDKELGETQNMRRWTIGSW